ncbi:hypothetical protein AALP_AAs42246U000100 [Arabis alpina]|uniref:DUF4283 domain-containing protein n=1 Tax=Arabis alpina TaxID=50452 RepID=A0A087G2Q4_ARAAL|nr:hypothetical protein AALP_AAs42246U000100 [Arabis alpina]
MAIVAFSWAIRRFLNRLSTFSVLETVSSHFDGETRQFSVSSHRGCCGFVISVVDPLFLYDVQAVRFGGNRLPWRINKSRESLLNKSHISYTALSILSCNELILSLLNFLDMADNLRRAVQDLSLGVEDEPVPLPLEVCSDAFRANQFSLMGRSLMPRRQNLRAIVSTLPRNWGLTGLISGRMIDRRKFQFVFPSEDLMQSVLNRGPWAFNDRMLVLQRWNPSMDDLMLNFIPFWVQIRGIPLQYLDERVIRYVGERLNEGEVDLVDYNPDVIAPVEFVRVQLTWNVDRPLKFQKLFQFQPGVNTLLKFHYERLRGFCATCGMLTHDTGECIHARDDQVVAEHHDDNGDDVGGVDPMAEVELGVGVNPEIPAPGPHNVGFYEPNAGVQAAEQDAFDSDVHPEYGSGNWDDFEADIAIVRGPEVAKRRRRFIQNLMAEDEANRSSQIVVPDTQTHAAENIDDLITEWEARKNQHTSLPEYGSFLGIPRSVLLSKPMSSSLTNTYKRTSGIICASNEIFNEADVFDSGPSQKKQRLPIPLIEKRIVVSTSIQPEYAALQKLRFDYGDPETSTPPGSPNTRGAVGPIPPQVP